VQLRKPSRSSLGRTVFEQGHHGRRASVCIGMSPRHPFLIRTPLIPLSYEDLDIGIPRCVNPENGASKCGLLWRLRRIGSCCQRASEQNLKAERQGL
jgi:hypothetical protein